MSKFDWEERIKMNVLILHYLGLWPKGENYEYNFYLFYVCLLCVFIYISHCVFHAINIYFMKSNLVALTGVIYSLIPEITATCKVLYMVRNGKVLKKLLNVLKRIIFLPRNERQILSINKSLNLWKFVYGYFFLMCLLTNIVWGILPFLNKSGEKQLPFMAWYPWDYTVSPYYELTFVHQILGGTLLTVNALSFDGIVAALNIFNGNQFDILSDNLRNLQIDGLDTVKEKLRNCIEHHIQILK